MQRVDGGIQLGVLHGVVTVVAEEIRVRDGCEWAVMVDRVPVGIVTCVVPEGNVADLHGARDGRRDAGRAIQILQVAAAADERGVRRLTGRVVKQPVCPARGARLVDERVAAGDCELHGQLRAVIQPVFRLGGKARLIRF